MKALAILALFLITQSSIFGSLIVTESDGLGDSVKGAENIVLGEVVDFKVSSKVVSTTMKRDVEWKKTKYTYTYVIKVTEDYKGGLESGDRIEAAFVRTLSSAKRMPQGDDAKAANGLKAYDGPISVSQRIAGSGQESSAKKGSWIFCMKANAEDKKAYRVLRVEKAAKGAVIKNLLTEKP
ncbi:MAG: hypothetical protein ACQCXQ_06515 [Verrucomicrobiales bacterium]|nr:hypothetical protein [Verrucomicrobiota bacterium JB025]